MLILTHFLIIFYKVHQSLLQYPLNGFHHMVSQRNGSEVYWFRSAPTLVDGYNIGQLEDGWDVTTIYKTLNINYLVL